MIARAPLPVSVAMALRLARLPAATRACPDLAAAALAPRFPEDAVRAHLSTALAVAARMAEAAASDRPWALALGWLRDLVAIAVLCGLGAYGWAVLS